MVFIYRHFFERPIINKVLWTSMCWITRQLISTVRLAPFSTWVFQDMDINDGVVYRYSYLLSEPNMHIQPKKMETFVGHASVPLWISPQKQKSLSVSLYCTASNQTVNMDCTCFLQSSLPKVRRGWLARDTCVERRYYGRASRNYSHTYPNRSPGQ